MLLNMNKKNVLVIGIIVAVILFLTGIYFIFFRNGEETPVPSNENPFGNAGESITLGENFGGEPGKITSGNIVSLSGEALDLWKISENPVSGATIVGTATSTTVKFVEKATGHIYEMPAITRQISRISNTTIPKSEKIIWGRNANKLLFQYETDETIKTYYAEVGTSTGSERALINGKFLSDNIGEIVSSKIADKILYLLSFPDASSIQVANFDGTNPSNVYASRIKDWLISWQGDGAYIATTKASAGILGYSYIIDSKSKNLSKILGGVLGLTVLADRTVNNILYSDSVQGKIGLNLLNRANKTDTTITPETLPEKCVWGTKNTEILYCGTPKQIPIGEYPDVWYKGSILFNDDIWKYDTSTGETDVVVDLTEKTKENIDVIDPVLSSDETFLIFRNKRDFSLWGLRLNPTKTSSN